MINVEWLLFLGQLPATPSSLRVKIWRRLREAGSTSLQNGVWILPRTDENTHFLERLLAYIKQNGAAGHIFLVHGITQDVQEDILKQFNEDRQQEYDEFLEKCEAFKSELEKEALHQKYTFAELEENEQNYQRLRKWVAKIQKRDFFNTQKSEEAVAAFQSCRQILLGYTRQVYTQEGIESSSKEGLLSETGLVNDQEKMDDF